MIPLRRAIPALLIGTLSAATPPDAVWSFDAEQAGALEAVGGVVFGEPGPRRPAYPRFSQTNRAVRFDGRGARLVVPDTGAGSIFDFGNGDAITLEAWVRPADVRMRTSAGLTQASRVMASPLPKSKMLPAPVSGTTRRAPRPSNRTARLVWLNRG